MAIVRWIFLGCACFCLCRSLSLSGNDLSGTLPAGVSALSKLSWLDLSDNQLTGSILDSVTTFTALA